MLANLVVVILYTNPFFLLLYDTSTSTVAIDASAKVAYADIFISVLGSAGFNMTWILFSDPVRFRSVYWIRFWWFKVILVLTIFLSSIIVLTIKYPSILISSTRSPVELIDSWPTSTAQTYLAFSGIALISEIVWFIYWDYCMYRSYKKLSRLAYMKTRYVQLSFRFFVFQAFFISIYFIFFFLLSAFWVLVSTNDGANPSLARLWNNINVSYALRSELDGRLLLISVFSLTLAFVYLPADAFTSKNVNSIASQLASSFVLTEVEREQAVRSRRKAIRRLNRMQQSLLANVSSNKSFVFCVDLGLLLCNASEEAYCQYPMIDTAIKVDNDQLLSLSEAKSDASGIEVIKEEEEDKLAEDSNLNDQLEANSNVSEMTAEEIRFISDAMRVVSEMQSQAVDKEIMWDFRKYGLTLIRQLIDEKTDTVLAICRQDSTNRIVLTFRGTSSSKNVMTDLKFQQLSIDLEKLPPATQFMLPQVMSMELIPEVDEAEDEESQITTNNESGVELSSTRQQPQKLESGHNIGTIDNTSRAQNETSKSKAKSTGGFQFHLPSLRHKHPNYSLRPNDVNNPNERDGDEDMVEEINNHDNVDNEENQEYATSPVSSRRFGTLHQSSVRHSTPRSTSMRAIEQGLTDGLDLFRNTVAGVTTTAVGVVTATANEIESAALKTAGNTPLLRSFYGCKVHAGFWEAFTSIREEMHKVIREELVREPADILVTGHSLGGALATLCALDLSIHTVPKMNEYLSTTDAKVRRERHGISNGHNGARKTSNQQFILSPKVLNVTMYNYGSPRVGNHSFQKEYDKWVPDSFRIVVDGDIIPGIPPSRFLNKAYKHVGTEILIDGLNQSGLVIIDPSFIEMSLRARSKTSVVGHSLITYRNGLNSVVTGIKNYHLLKQHGESSEGDIDGHVGELLMQRYDSAIFTGQQLKVTISDVHRGLEPDQSGIMGATDLAEPAQSDIQLDISLSRKDSEEIFFDCIDGLATKFGIDPETAANVGTDNVSNVDTDDFTQALSREFSKYEDCKTE